jgi:hypothetical protein
MPDARSIAGKLYGACNQNAGALEAHCLKSVLAPRLCGTRHMELNIVCNANRTSCSPSNNNRNRSFSAWRQVQFSRKAPGKVKELACGKPRPHRTPHTQTKCHRPHLAPLLRPISIIHHLSNTATNRNYTAPLPTHNCSSQDRTQSSHAASGTALRSYG